MPLAIQSQLEIAGRQWRRLHPRARRLPRQYAPRHPVGIEYEYGRSISYMLEFMQNKINQLIVPRLPALVGEANLFRDPLVRKDDATDVHRLFREISILTQEAYTDDELFALSARYGHETSVWNQKTISRNIYKVIGINPLFQDSYIPNELKLFATTNVNLIESLRDDTLKKLETQVLVDLQRGTRAEVIAKELEAYIDPRVGNARARANLIARDQVAKLNGQLTKLRQTDIGVTRYTWRTMGDARVRDSHEELNGQVFSWDDPPEPGHPGEDYQCRCYAEPVLEDVIDVE